MGAVQQGKRPSFSEHWESFQGAHRHRAPDDGPPIAWEPDDAVREHSNLFQLQNELGLQSYEALHRFSVDEPEAFWSRVLVRLGIVFENKPQRILDLDNLGRGVKHPRWLPGAELDITRSCFTAPRDKTAIVFGREDHSLVSLSYEQLEKEVDRFAEGLRARGFESGDGVALYMPMTPECVIAYLGTVRAGC